MSEIDWSTPLVCDVDDVECDVCFCRVMCNGDLVIEYINQLGSRNWCFVLADRVSTSIRNKKEPRYCPYTFDEAKFFVGQTIIHRPSRDLVLVTGLRERAGQAPEILVRYGWTCLADACSTYTHLNGEPFGVKLDE